MRSFLFLFLISSPGLFTGCANTRIAHTDFLPQTDPLTHAPEKEVAFIPDTAEIHKSLQLGWDQYHSILIDPVAFDLQPETHQPKKTTLERLGRKFQGHLAKRLEDRFVIQDQPGSGILRLRTNVVELNPQNILINILGIIVALPPDMGGISAEFVVTDSLSNRPLFVMAVRRDGSPLLILESFTTYGHAHWGIKKWGKLLEECMTDAPRMASTSLEGNPL